jgi:autotransporter-associated beta strand protein
MSGTATLNATTVRLNVGGAIPSTINLDGGTLTANQIVAGGGNGAKTLNLNGGVLKPGVTNTTDWMNGALAVNVKAGGAKFDTNGFDARVNPALLHDAGLGATHDGGLTKSGAGTLTLAGANTYTGGTNVLAGTLQVTRMHENNPVNITAGKLQVLDSSPTLPDHPSGDNAFVSRPSALTIANNGAPIGARTFDGQLDLGNNDLILDYAGARPRAEIEEMVRAGFNGGNWLGNGITSSTANANRNYAIAVADNSQLVIPFGDGTTGRLFSGQAVDSTTILVKFTHRIDLDLDGVITSNDASIFNSRFNEGAPAYWSIGDVDYDHVFTSNDASIFNSFYNEALASVPEPASLGVFGIGALGLLGRRRRAGTSAAAD